MIEILIGAVLMLALMWVLNERRRRHNEIYRQPPPTEPEWVQNVRDAMDREQQDRDDEGDR